MTISPVVGSNTFLTQQLVDTRNQLDELQAQLGSGRKSETYRGLGRDAAADVAFRQQISTLQGYQQTIDRVNIRLGIYDNALTQIDDLTGEARGAINPNAFEVLGNGRTLAQETARVSLGEALSILNVQADGRYVFSGRSADVKPVVDVDTLLDGEGGRAGFRQAVDERKQADLGTSGLGRTTVSRVTDTVTFAEDGAHPFGFKIDAINNTLSNVTVTSTAGPPRSEDFQFTAQPVAGETIRIETLLPDGSRETITLTAATTAGEENTFVIGATPTDTATNFEAALTAAVQASAGTALEAASAVQAGNDFFTTTAGQAPQRVDGPPFDTATALRDGSADTVIYYVGDNAADDPRTTSSARIDSSLVIDYGARANEPALSQAIRSLAVFAVETFSETDTNDSDRYTELATRTRQNLSFPSGTESITDIHVEIVGISEAVESARQRHISAENTLTQMVEEIEGINLEEVSAQIVTLQTRLQASYQTTALLNRLSLTNYI
ncbi:MAG: hypothetical protein AAGL24_17730 [Pseudomonadota bacterium]